MRRSQARREHTWGGSTPGAGNAAEISSIIGTVLGVGHGLRHYYYERNSAGDVGASLHTGHVYYTLSKKEPSSKVFPDALRSARLRQIYCLSWIPGFRAKASIALGASSLSLVELLKNFVAEYIEELL